MAEAEPLAEPILKVSIDRWSFDVRGLRDSG
jgi:hypothetical protein